MSRICFLGDVHLGCDHATESQRLQLFRALLSVLPGYCSHVVILGDLFDFWFDYRTVIPKAFWQSIAALGALRDRGVTVDYLIGNHDFGHWRFFREELGIEPHPGDLERQWYGLRFYIAHGDDKIPGDWGYLILRSVLRNRTAQRLYRMLHPDLGIGLARWASRMSRYHGTEAPQRLIDSLERFARKKLAEGYDVVVLGHSHAPALKSFDKGWYVNPGGWLNGDPLFACFDGKGLSLLRVREFLRAMGENFSSSANTA